MPPKSSIFLALAGASLSIFSFCFGVKNSICSAISDHETRRAPSLSVYLLIHSTDYADFIALFNAFTNSRREFVAREYVEKVAMRFARFFIRVAVHRYTDARPRRAALRAPRFGVFCCISDNDNFIHVLNLQKKIFFYKTGARSRFYSYIVAGRNSLALPPAAPAALFRCEFSARP